MRLRGTNRKRPMRFAGGRAHSKTHLRLIESCDNHSGAPAGQGLRFVFSSVLKRMSIFCVFASLEGHEGWEPSCLGFCCASLSMAVQASSLRRQLLRQGLRSSCARSLPLLASLEPISSVSRGRGGLASPQRVLAATFATKAWRDYYL